MASKFYAVQKGKIPGIYYSWDDCKKMVDGFPGAVYKSFKTLEEAEAFVGAEGSSRKRSEKQKNQIQGSRNKIRQSTPLSTALTTLPPKSTATADFSFIMERKKCCREAETMRRWHLCAMFQEKY